MASFVRLGHPLHRGITNVEGHVYRSDRSTVHLPVTLLVDRRRGPRAGLPRAS